MLERKRKKITKEKRRRYTWRPIFIEDIGGRIIIRRERRIESGVIRRSNSDSRRSAEEEKRISITNNNRDACAKYY